MPKQPFQAARRKISRTFYQDRAIKLMRLTTEQRQARIAMFQECRDKHHEGLTKCQRSLLKSDLEMLNAEEWREKLVDKKLSNVTSATVRLCIYS